MKPQQVSLRLNARDTEAIRRVQELITTDLTQHYTIPALARKVHVNECKLKAGFRTMYGKGIWTYLSDLRLQKARQQLAETELSVKEVAFGLGYRYVANFVTCFKRKWGCTPGEIRREDIQ